LGYLEDLSLGGRPEDVRHDLAIIADLESTLGVRLNRQKCEILSEEEISENSFDNFQRINRESLILLGEPLFRGKALDEALQDLAYWIGR